MPGFVAQITICKGLPCESSVIVDFHEQLDPDDMQDPELGKAQPFTDAARIAIDLV